MTYCKIRNVQNASNRSVKKPSQTRKPRHVDSRCLSAPFPCRFYIQSSSWIPSTSSVTPQSYSHTFTDALVAISHLYKHRHHERFKFFRTELVLQTIERTYNRNRDTEPLGKYCGRNIQSFLLKALEKGGYIRFNATKTRIRVTNAAARMMLKIRNQVNEATYNSNLQKHRAHCDFYRQCVGTVSRMPYKELEQRLEDVEQQYAEHIRTCRPASTESRANSSVEETATGLSPLSALLDFQSDTEGDTVHMEEDHQPNAGPSSIPLTPAPERQQRPSLPNPEHAYRTPTSLPPRRLQRTGTQPALSPPQSPMQMGSRASFAVRIVQTGITDQMDVDGEEEAVGPSSSSPQFLGPSLGRTLAEYQAHARTVATIALPNIADVEPAFEVVEETLRDAMTKSHLKDAKLESKWAEFEKERAKTEEGARALQKKKHSNRRMAVENVELGRQVVFLQWQHKEYVQFAAGKIKTLQDQAVKMKDDARKLFSNGMEMLTGWN